MQLTVYRMFHTRSRFSYPDEEKVGSECGASLVGFFLLTQTSFGGLHSLCTENSEHRESEMQVGDETKTQEGMSDKGQGQRGKESFEREMENLKLPFVSMKACECSSVSPKTLFLHKSL